MTVTVEFDPFPGRHAHNQGLVILRRLDELEAHLHALGRRLMSDLDDIKAAQVATNAALDTIATEAQTLATEVADLIARLAPTDLTEIKTLAAGIQTRTEGIASALAAIPAEPKA